MTTDIASESVLTKFSLGNETKFIPGIKGDDGSFTPGQVVNTPDGEEFVCGQLVETANGPKFMPGQVITLKNGEMKFVPGVTDRNGRFVPGQILDTIAGPTFIPGQICYTGTKAVAKPTAV